MTLNHKIRLVFSRFTWWLRITEKSKKYYDALQDYYYFYGLYNKKMQHYIEEHRKKPSGELALKLKGQVELLAEILDIRQ